VQTELHRAAKKECANGLAQQPALAKNSKWRIFWKLKYCFLAEIFSVEEILATKFLFVRKLATNRETTRIFANLPENSANHKAKIADLLKIAQT
jgi:hypothetical protein